MPDTETYTQCKLCRGRTEQIAWIPTSLAILGQIVKVEENGKQSLWTVKQVYGTRTRKAVEDHERDYLRQRKVSDI